MINMIEAARFCVLRLVGFLSSLSIKSVPAKASTPIEPIVFDSDVQ